MLLTDTFLGGNFLSYGPSVLSYLGGDVTNINNPLNIVFPKVSIYPLFI